MSVTKLIEGKELTKSFGGLTAVKRVDFYLGEGEIVGLIGPNGAGKTTLFNLVSGVFHTYSGILSFGSRDITLLKPFEICRLGVARTFQIVRPFLKMSCFENTLVGIIGRSDTHGGREERREEAQKLLEFIGLGKRGQTL